MGNKACCCCCWLVTAPQVYDMYDIKGGLGESVKEKENIH